MSSPTVSVVMSVYNDQRYLRGALESILHQEGVDFEFIIVNDGSRDDSPAILREYQARDPRLRVIDQENAGLTMALIRGCREARGRFIARQDADDLSMPGRLRKLKSLLDADDRLVFVSSWAEVVGPEDEPLRISRRPADPDAAARQILGERVGPPGHGSVMFRREIYERIGGYRPQLYYAQDSDLWLRLVLLGKIAYAQEVLYRYRVSDVSLSGGRHEEKVPFAAIVDELHAARLAGIAEGPILERAAGLPRSRGTSAGNTSEGMTLYFIGKCLFNNGDPRAYRYFRRSILKAPLHLRAWVFFFASAPRALLKRTV